MNFELNSMIELLQKDPNKFNETYLEENISYARFQDLVKSHNISCSEKNMWKILCIFAEVNNKIISEKWVTSMISREQFITFVQNKNLFFNADLSDSNSYKLIAETMQKIIVLTTVQLEQLIKALKNVNKKKER